MENNNNPSGYTSPTPSAVSASLIPRPEYSSMAAPVYIISTLCQTSVKKYMYDTNDPRYPDPEPRWIDCGEYEANALPYFACLCGSTNSLSRNRYFSADCVLKECVGDNMRRLFLKQYRAGCKVNGSEPLIDISADWAPYDQPPGSARPTSPFTSTTAQLTTHTNAQPSTYTQPSTLTQATSTVTSTVLSNTSTTPITTINTNSTSSAMTTPTGPADGQISICGISQRCMTNKPQGEASCDADDLDCICKASNSLENNTEFDQQCVLDACYGDIGREEFLDSLYYHCKKVDKELTDIPKRWEPYLPATFPTSTTGSAPTEPGAPVPAPATVKFGGGAIAGTVIGIVVIIGVVLCLLRMWWNTKKKAKKLRVENAQLQDATNPDGMSRRINTLISDSSRRSFALGQGPGAETSMYGGASTYNDATLVGSPRSTAMYLVQSTNAAAQPVEYKEYGSNEEDYAMSEYNKYNGHGRQYSQGHHELPSIELQDIQTAPEQRDVYDDSVSEYSRRRMSYDNDSVDIRQESEAREQWDRAQRDEWEREREQDRNRRSAR